MVELNPKKESVLERVRFGRCLIEIAADSTLPRTVGALLDSGIILDEAYALEWIPPRCRRCISFGHSDESCPKTHKWVEKESTNASMKVDEGESSKMSRDKDCTAGVCGNDLKEKGIYTMGTYHPIDAMESDVVPAPNLGNSAMTSSIVEHGIEIGLHSSSDVTEAPISSFC